ncbi:MAG TPA: MarR family transcriptional regulator [Azospirillum sp.]|nr:MarR family transcriptional regulator [Azospirillum sp.]
MDDAVEAHGDGPMDVEAAADLVARPELRLWLRLSACDALIGQRLRTRLREAFETTPARFDLMALLDKEPDGLTMGELSKRLMVTNGNVTGIVDRLEQDGLATRGSASHDRRTQFVRLTPSGRAAFRTMAEAHQSWLMEMMGGLKRDEIVALLGLLDRLKRSVRGGAR